MCKYILSIKKYLTENKKYWKVRYPRDTSAN